MGWLDFITGGEDAQIKRHAKRLINLNAQAEDRDISAYWLAELGTDEAIEALVGRFGMTLDHHMRDTKEKDTVYKLLVGIGPGVTGPVKEWARTSPNFARPLKLVEHFEGEEAAVAMMLDLVSREKDPFKTEKKKQLLIKLAEYRHADIRDGATVYLSDLDEGVRYAAAEALLAQDDDDVRDELLAVLANPDEDSNRLRVRIAEAFQQRGWTLGEHAAAVGDRPPAGWTVNGDRLQPE